MIPPIDDFFSYMENRDNGITHEEILELAGRIAQEDGENDLQSTLSSVIERLHEAEMRRGFAPDFDEMAPAQDALQRLGDRAITLLQGHQSKLQSTVHTEREDLAQSEQKKRELLENFLQLERLLHHTTATTQLQTAVETVTRKIGTKRI